MTEKRKQISDKVCNKENETVSASTPSNKRQDTKPSVSLEEFKKWGCKCTG